MCDSSVVVKDDCGGEFVVTPGGYDFVREIKKKATPGEVELMRLLAEELKKDGMAK